MMFDFLISSSFAQEAAQAPGNPGILGGLAPMVVVFAIFWFLVIRPQQRRMKEEQSMINALAKGDEVYTKSGVIGVITGMTEKIITLEVAEGVKVKILKGHIGGRAKDVFEKNEKKA